MKISVHVTRTSTVCSNTNSGIDRNILLCDTPYCSPLLLPLRR